MLHRKSVFVTLLVSYCLLLFLSLAAGGLVYRIMERSLTANVNKANFGMLEQVQQTVDGRLREIERMMLQLSMNTDVQWLLHNAESEHGVAQIRAISLMKNMNAQLSVSDFLDFAFISFRDRDMIVTPTAQTGHDLYFKRIQQFRIAGNMRQFLAESRHKAFLPSLQVTENGSTRSLLAYIQSLPLDETADPKGSIVILVDERKMAGLLDRIEWGGDSSSYVLDRDGNVIFASRPHKELDASLRTRLGTAHESFTARYDGTEMMVSYATGDNGWKYVSVVPKSIVMEPIEPVKTLILQLLGFAAVAGLIVSCAFAYRSYKPLRDMLGVIANRKSGLSQNSMNEYELIRSALIHSFEEEKELKLTLDRQAPIIRANFLSRLIKGNVDVSILDRQSLDFMDVKLDHRSYRVVLIEIEDGSKLMQTETEREWALLRFIVANLSGELLRGNGFVVELERNRLAVLEVDADDRREDVWLHELRQAAEARFRMSLAIAVSPTRDDPQHIWRCYSDALLALERRFVRGPQPIMYHEEPARAKPHIYRYPPELEVQFINHAKTGDYDKAASLLDQIIEANFAEEQLSPEMGRFLFFEVLGSLLRAAHSTDSEYSPPEGLDDPIAFFAECATAEQMLERLKEALRSICLAAKGGRTDQGERLYGGIVSFIERHYGDGNLSLTMIADHFGITAPYCSAFFKKYGGGNLSEHIAEYRVAQAKRMLAETSLTIGDISRKVGYANHIGFGRVFKKIEGITPGQYRDLQNRDKTVSPIPLNENAGLP